MDDAGTADSRVSLSVSAQPVRLSVMKCLLSLLLNS